MAENLEQKAELDLSSTAAPDLPDGPVLTIRVDRGTTPDSNRHDILFLPPTVRAGRGR